MSGVGLSHVAGVCLAAGILVAAAPASAQTQQQIDQCENKGNTATPDLRIAGCTAAIQSGRWKGRGLAWAYNNRCWAYNDKRGQADSALADCNQAIKLDPKIVAAYHNRGVVWSDKRDLDRAMADYNEAIKLDPKFARAYFGRGLANLYAGALPKALADLSQASALDPKSAYTALWLDIVGQRSKLPSSLPQVISQIDVAAWPGPVIQLFLGRLTPAAVLAAADNPDAGKKKGQVCEANFYSGELALRRRAKDEAERLFRLSVSGCPKNFDEWFAANQELKALGLVP
jgi:lipoprotein NlpI